jgi:hypothetical protein
VSSTFVSSIVIAIFDASRTLSETHTSFAPLSFSDDALFRRIPVLIDCAGNIYLTWFNFHELTRHAILIFTGEDPSNTTEVDVNPYKVTFFYTDVDGDKTMIAFDSDLEQAVRQFKQKGGLKIFANIKSVQDLPEAPPIDGLTSCGSFAQTSTHTTAAASLSPGKVPKELQEMVAAVAAAAAAAAVIAVWEHVEPPTNATKVQTSNYVPLNESRNTSDQICKAPSIAAHSVPFIYSANNTAAHSVPFIYSANNDRGDRFRTAPIIAARFHAAKAQDGDDETAASMPELTPLKDYYTTCKQAGMSGESACEEEPAGHSDQQESDDESDDYMRRDQIRTTPSTAAHSVPFIYSAYNTAAHSAPFIYSANNTRGDRFRTTPIIAARFHAAKAQDGDDETATSMPELAPIKNYYTTCKQAGMSDETACEEEPAGHSDQQESDDESDDYMRRDQIRMAPSTAAHSVPFICSANNTTAHSVPFIYSANNTRGDRFRTTPIIAARFHTTKEQDGDDETAASMPELAALKDYYTTCKQAGMSSETACEEEQAGNSDQQESDDYMPLLVLRASPVKLPLPKEVDIVCMADAEPSFASDSKGIGETNAVSRAKNFAQALDRMREFDRRESAEEIEKEIVVEAVKDKEGVDEDDNSLISEPEEDVEDDCSHDGWDVVVAVYDHSDVEVSRA